MTYNLQKKAQQGTQQVAASPAEAMNLQKVMQQQDAIIARFNAELQQLQANAQTNPQAAQNQIQNVTTQLQAAQQTRQQAYMALWNYNNSPVVYWRKEPWRACPGFPIVSHHVIIRNNLRRKKLTACIVINLSYAIEIRD